MWKHPWRTIGGIFFILAMLVVVCVWQINAKKHRDRAKVGRKIAELNKRGFIFSTAEFAKKYPDPAPAENAELLLKTALDKVSGAPSLYEIVGSPGGLARAAPWPEDLRKAVATDMERNGPALRALPNTYPPGARFSHWWWGGFTNVLSHGIPFVGLRKLHQALCLAAIASAENGQGEEALGYLAKQFRVTLMIRSSGMLVEFMVARAIEAQTCQVLERVLNRAFLAEETPMLALDELISRALEKDIAPTVMLEIAVGNWIFECQRAGDTDTLRMIGLSQRAQSPVEAVRNWFFEWRDVQYDAEEHLQYLLLQEELVDVLKQPPHLILRQIRQWENHALSESARNRIVAFAVPHWRRAAESDLRIRSLLLAAKAALAVERFRLARGALPEMLSDLAPEFLPAVPKDLFDGQPLRYQRLEPGYIVYSVGPNAQDDTRGKRVKAIDEDKADDVRFILER